MDILDKEILELWRSFYQNKVKYIMVGGFATNFHGFSRITADLSIWLEDSLDNRQKFRKSIAQIGVGRLCPIGNNGHFGRLHRYYVEFWN